MPDFASCSTNVADITEAQFCGGFGGCNGVDGVKATAENLNGVLSLFQIAINEVATGVTANTAAIALLQAALLPVGSIILWNGGAIPTGWVICDGGGATPDLRDRFVMGAGPTFGAGTTGGALTHDHAFTVDSATSGVTLATSTDNVDSSGGTPVLATASLNDLGHTHNATTAAESNLPPYYALAYIMKV